MSVRPKRLPESAPERSEEGAPRRASRWTPAIVVASVVIPFTVALVRLATAPGGHVYLSDDLALIDLHTREALHWRQQLGPFDRYGWHHPGPSYFYVLALFARVLGSGARAEFLGATAIGALAALGAMSVAYRRASPAVAAWTAAVIGVVAIQLSFTGPSDLTYSESPLGALESPWNATVIVLPLLLCLLLCAAGASGSPLSLVGALLTGSFVIQTDISTLPLVVTSLVASTILAVTTASRLRATDPDQVLPGRGRPGARSRARSVVWALAGAIVFAAMWTPPLVQQATHRPGNITLLLRFFTSGKPGQSFGVGLRSIVAAWSVPVFGPSQVMAKILGGSVAHATPSYLLAVLVVGLGVASSVVGWRRKNRFGTALGTLAVLGAVVSVVAVGRITGFVTGYLVLWAVVVPALAAIAIGAVAWEPVAPRAHTGRSRPLSIVPVLCAAAVGVGLTARTVELPPLAKASDPVVAHLAQIVVPALGHRRRVYVGINWDNLVSVEEFIGLVDDLDVRGFHPTVSPFWLVQFGTRYVGEGRGEPQVMLSRWTPSSRASPGYLGQTGGFAVTITGSA